MRSRRAVLAGAASLVLALSACGGAESTSSAKGSTVGISMPTRTSERWLTDGKAISDDLKTRRYKTTLVYGDDDPDKQAAQIADMIKQGVDALIVAAIDNRSLNDVLQQAADADIPVIAYDRLILGTKNVAYYVSFDNEQVGRLQAHYIIDKLGLEKGEGPFNIELFAGSSDDNNTSYFYEGAMHLLQPFLDSKQLVVRSGQTKLTEVNTQRWDGATAQKRMQNILTKSYSGRRVDAVLSPYDGISLGILAALKSDGYGAGGSALPIITGQDAELASVKSIIKEQQAQTVYKDLHELAFTASTMVDDILNSRTPNLNNRSSYNNGVKVVPAYLLQPESVDRTNYEQVLVKGGYYSSAELK